MLPLRAATFKLVDRLSQAHKKVCLALVDVSLAPTAFLFATIVLHNALPDRAFLQVHSLLLPVLAGLGGLCSILLHMPKIKLNAYDTHGVLRTGVMALLVSLGLVLILMASNLHFPQLGIILFGLFFFLMAVAARFAMLHLLLWALRAGHPRNRVIIYGAGRTGIQLLAALRGHDTILPVAFVDDNPALSGMTAGGLHIYSPDRIIDLTTRLGVDRVLLAMPSLPKPKLAQIVRKLHVMGLTALSVPSFAQITGVERLVDALTLVDPDAFLGRMQVEQAIPLGGEAYGGRVVLVSGAGGSVGAALCRRL